MMDSARTGARIGCGGASLSAEAASRPENEGTMTDSTSGDLPPAQASRPSLARNGSARPVCIVQIGSALAYRSIPLQSAYCAAKAAARGFTDSLRSELLHEGSAIRLTMAHLPAVNTPQFDWARNHMHRRPQPVPPIHQPEPIA